MPRFGRLTAGQVREKSSRFDVVTAADEATEQAITAALAGAYSGAAIVGEEAAGRNPELLEAHWHR